MLTTKIIVGLALIVYHSGATFGADPNEKQRISCDQEREFLCWSDNKCIPRAKLCNFVKDCSNGADETLCGTCNFDKNPKRCGLRFVGDRVFGWLRRTPATNDVKLHQEHELLESNANSSKLDYYMRLDFNNSMLQAIQRHENDLSTTYKPKVLFPLLKATNNAGCRFSFEVLISKQTGRLVKPDISQNSWPKVEYILVQPKRHKESSSSSSELRNRNKFERERKALQLKVRRGVWNTKEIQLGERRSSWTMELSFEVRIKSYLVYLGDFKFVDCEPVGATSGNSSEVATEFPLELDQDNQPKNNCNETSQFRCKYSGLCIAQGQLCDFNLDCGEDDRSDEDQCDHFPGRCDFESQNLCHWLATPSKDSWSWMSAFEEDQVFYGKLPRAPVDHTFLSQAAGGHYLMIKDSQVKSSASLGLMGPRVTLVDGFESCDIRFWLYSAGEQNSPSPSLVSPYLMVGDRRLPASQLFGKPAAKGTSGWRRFDVSILSRERNNQINSLRISLENFENQASVFRENRAVFAIDDISFTPGCKLVERGTGAGESCGDHQYHCKVPTPTSRLSCIPIEYHCDFKNDCGLLLEGGQLADDELECPRKCLFSSKDKAHCGVRVLDGSELRLAGEIDESQSLNEAFEWSVVDSAGLPAPLAGHLLIEANFKPFLENYMSWRQRGAADGQYNLRNLRLEMPTFSRAHANCRFRLDYQWAPNTTNLHAYLLLTTDEADQEVILKKLRGAESKSGNASVQTLEFGLGHRAGPFRLVLEAALEGSLTSMVGTAPSGFLRVFSYQFSMCSFFPGILDASSGEQFADDLEQDTEGDFDIFDSEALNTTCESGFFQCQQPVVCIPAELVCDMQLDCQGGLDERNCQRHLQFDFEADQASFELQNGWWNEQREQESCGRQWLRLKGSTLRDRTLDLGPPYDHTKATEDGCYLSILHQAGAAANVSPDLKEAACLKSAAFRPASGCRFILYLYRWGHSPQSQANRLEIFIERDVEGEKQLQQLYDTSSEPQRDWWQRVELTLEPSERQTRLLVRGHEGEHTSGTLAIDDLSFSPECNIPSPAATSTTTEENYQVHTSGATFNQWTASLERPGSSAALGSLTVAVIVLVIAGLGVYRLRASRSAERVTTSARYSKFQAGDAGELDFRVVPAESERTGQREQVELFRRELRQQKGEGSSQWSP